MIRKTLLIVAGIVFGVGVLGASTYRNSEKVLAQKISTEEGKTATEEMVVVEEGEGVVQDKVDYVLPYPGMLPDSKFYFLKMVRDKIWGLLIFDEVKKIDWLVLMGDKRLAAGKVLIDTGKSNLGVSTIIKGERYMTEAVDRVEVAYERNINVYDQLEHLRKSLLKHQEILREEIKKVDGGEKGSLEELLEPLGERILKVKGLLGIDERNGEGEEQESGEEIEVEEELETVFGEE